MKLTVRHTIRGATESARELKPRRGGASVRDCETEGYAMRYKSLVTMAFVICFGATTLSAQVAPPPAPWRGAGPTPCVGSDGGIYKCVLASPQIVAIRAGHLF